MSRKLKQFHVLRDQSLKMIRVDGFIRLGQDASSALQVCLLLYNLPETKPSSSHYGDIHPAVSILVKYFSYLGLTTYACHLAIVQENNSKPLISPQTVANQTFVARLEYMKCRYLAGVQNEFEWKKREDR